MSGVTASYGMLLDFINVWRVVCPQNFYGLCQYRYTVNTYSHYLNIMTQNVDFIQNILKIIVKMA